ncbi:ABC transporter ATP-binding protein [Ruegeria sp.]|uniref:ABC transporter ATP-binding protein n=1 Tax=Ruegeria sp. TaxID=1879320 RepID=UPI002312B910|nr:ABC transporter ATP-binding protein [Ruegeria sp.]MDA7965328.1 ABC transporter ATP-binding protein [Ruegeria sp.]
MQNFIEISDVSKTYWSEDGKTETKVVLPLSMTIAEGEMVMFLGPSGCGKTTLMRIIGGLETQDHGEIHLQGERLAGPDRRRGMVFQSYSSFPWLSVRDNIKFGTRYRKDISAQEKEEVTDHYMNMVGLTRYADFYTNRISGGMRQRVAIARTLASSPKVLLMDEPFGALDAQTREYLQLQLMDINAREKKTTVFVTHDVEEAILLASRIVIFSSRPARIVKEIRVDDLIPPESRRDGSLDMETFMALRADILKIIRAEYAHTLEDT